MPCRGGVGNFQVHAHADLTLNKVVYIPYTLIVYFDI